MTIVQLDPVQAIFSLPIAASREIRQGARVTIGIGETLRHADGFVDAIAPTADARSGTVRVKIRIPNPKREILSGFDMPLDRWWRAERGNRPKEIGSDESVRPRGESSQLAR